MPKVSRWLSGAWLWGMMFLVEASSALAQGPPAPVAPAGPPAGSQLILRSLWPEVLITVVMMALALYAVCRNSRRQ